MPGPHFGPNQSGFSLLELLVVMALMGLMMVLMAGGLQFAGRSATQLDTAARALHQAASAQSRLRALIRLARPFDVLVPPGAVQLAGFSGRPQQLSFTAQAAIAGLPNGLMRYNLELGLEEKSTSITLNWEDASNPRIHGQQRLAGHPGPLSIQYGRVDSQRNVVWSSAWLGQAGLPDLVKITSGTRHSGWPDLIIAIAPGEPPGCAFSVATQTCTVQ